MWPVYPGPVYSSACVKASDSLLAMFAGVTAGSPGGGVPGQQHGEEVTDYWQTPCHHAKGMYSYVTHPCIV